MGTCALPTDCTLQLCCKKEGEARGKGRGEGQGWATFQACLRPAVKISNLEPDCALQCCDGLAQISSGDTAQSLQGFLGQLNSLSCTTSALSTSMMLDCDGSDLDRLQS